MPVRLYYLGGLAEADGATRPITSHGRAFVLPKAGEFLDLEEVYAKDFERRFNVGGTYFTRERAMADRVKTGQPIVRTDINLAELSEEQILAELARRKANAVTVTEEFENNDEAAVVAASGKRGK